ncbi:hypothetical protein LCGC14_2505740, partial [marine sediment metagenome]
MKKRHFLKCKFVDFAKENRQDIEDETDEYSRVLKDIGIKTEKSTRLKLSSMPLYVCIIDIA